MASQQQKPLKVKINNNDDTRLWRYSSIDDYEGLCTFISTTWQNDDFIAQYEDDEGDLITIASKQDLKDAFDFAREENKKSLKIFVQNYVKQKREQKKAEQASESKENEQDQGPPKQFGSTREMVFDFLSNKEIVLLLPEFFGALITKLIEKGNNLKVDEIVNLIYDEIKDNKYNPVTSHPLYLKYGALVIPYVANRISQQQSLYPHFRMDTIKTWINQLIQMLYQVLQQTESTMGCSFKDIVIDIQYPTHTDTGKVIHFGVECDLCGQYPIIGDRYKCSICEDWDCCPKCEPKHDHPLIKFKQSSKNHANSSFKGLTEIVKRLSPESDEQRNDNNNNLNIDDIDIYDDIVVDCTCGSKMECVVAKKAYKRCNTVYCDLCSAQFFNEMVYHCPMGNDARFHKGGFDLCIKCANKKVEAEKAEQQQQEEEDIPNVDEQKEEAPKQEEQAPAEPSAPEEPEQEQEQEQEQVEVPQEPKPEEPKPEEPKEEEFLYAAQLTTIKQIMALNDDESDDMIKTLLIQNKGDITRVVPMLLQ